MENEAEYVGYLRCWHCKYFYWFQSSETYKELDGLCMQKNIQKQMLDLACKNFMLKPGVHTQKILPPDAE